MRNILNLFLRKRFSTQPVTVDAAGHYRVSTADVATLDHVPARRSQGRLDVHGTALGLVYYGLRLNEKSNKNNGLQKGGVYSAISV
jgi:hypothetical protein